MSSLRLTVGAHAARDQRTSELKHFERLSVGAGPTPKPDPAKFVAVAVPAPALPAPAPGPPPKPPPSAYKLVPNNYRYFLTDDDEPPGIYVKNLRGPNPVTAVALTTANCNVLPIHDYLLHRELYYANGQQNLTSFIRTILKNKDIIMSKGIRWKLWEPDFELKMRLGGKRWVRKLFSNSQFHFYGAPPRSAPAQTGPILLYVVVNVPKATTVDKSRAVFQVNVRTGSGWPWSAGPQKGEGSWFVSYQRNMLTDASRWPPLVDFGTGNSILFYDSNQHAAQPAGGAAAAAQPAGGGAAADDDDDKDIEFVASKTADQVEADKRADAIASGNYIDMGDDEDD